jgi:hypothetical protein
MTTLASGDPCDGAFFGFGMGAAYGETGDANGDSQ